MWKLALVAVLWSLWLERKNRTFQGCQNHYKAVVDSILSKVVVWVVRYKKFHRYGVDSIMRD